MDVEKKKRIVATQIFGAWKSTISNVLSWMELDIVGKIYIMEKNIYQMFHSERVAFCWKHVKNVMKFLK